MDAALNLRFARPLPWRSMRRFVVLGDLAGDDRQPVRLLPCRGLAASILPIVGRPSRATCGCDNLGGGVGGKGFSEGHEKTLHRKNKSAMPKITLANRRQCRHNRGMKANLTRKQQEALASLVMQQVANLKEYSEMRDSEPELAEVSSEEIGKQLSIWMKKLPGTIWDNRLPL